MARTSAASPGAETRATESSSTGAPAGGEGGQQRVSLVDLGHPAPLRPGAERGAPQTRRPLTAEQAHGSGSGEGGHEVPFHGIELEVVEHEHLGLGHPAPSCEALRRRRQQRDGVGGLPVERVVEAAVEAAQAAQTLGVPGRMSCPLGIRLEALRRNAPLAQGPKRPGERRRHRPPRQVGGEPEAGATLGEKPGGEQRIVAVVPRAQPPSEEKRLGQRAGEVEDLERIEAGERPSGGGESTGQLDHRRHRRTEEDERAQGHGGEPILARSHTRGGPHRS
jgi:hypothetical protein